MAAHVREWEDRSGLSRQCWGVDSICQDDSLTIKVLHLAGEVFSSDNKSTPRGLLHPLAEWDSIEVGQAPLFQRGRQTHTLTAAWGLEHKGENCLHLHGGYPPPHMPPGLPLRSASPLWSGTPWNMRTLGQGRSHPQKWAISRDSELCGCQSDLSAVFREDASDLPPHIPGDRQPLQEAHVGVPALQSEGVHHLTTEERRADSAGGCP